MAKAGAGLTLVAGGASGDNAGKADLPSLETLYREHAAAIGAIGLRLLGRRAEADDLVQDVFIAAHEGLHQLQSPEAARSWLSTTSHSRENTNSSRA